jgi:hypothetical protein
MRIVMFFANSDQTPSRPEFRYQLGTLRNVLPRVQRSAGPFVIFLVLPSLQQLPAVLSGNHNTEGKYEEACSS